ncbi:NUDIX domain-containing protein [bacterium]|nr:NUDIX domain-containing protein [bacterium]
MYQLPIPVVRAIICNQKNEILLLKRSHSTHDSGSWCLPGGKVEFGDTIEDTVEKEIEEETALKCISKRFLFYLDNLPTESLQEHYITFYFECHVTGEIVLNEESSEYVWAGFEAMDQYDIVFLNDLALRKYWAV